MPSVPEAARLTLGGLVRAYFGIGATGDPFLDGARWAAVQALDNELLGVVPEDFLDDLVDLHVWNGWSYEPVPAS